ncbi:DUF503 domain-containing protein [uncultured Desulfovibrio sp.]|uniref:DUF503 domain-containing protein n=1 Tax=uncultured Desulfovibrio sp. TaxID=167968 RepID=UPI00263A0D25|nr:DUF503 domain-containing protein [uncultured Desulfovibrio sp.]
MFLAVLTVEFALRGNDNLKAKRRVANSLKQKVRNRFNVAVAEAGTEDSLTRLRLAVASLSNSESHLRSRMDKCALMMEAVCPEEMIDSEVEIYVAD